MSDHGSGIFDIRDGVPNPGWKFNSNGSSPGFPPSKGGESRSPRTVREISIATLEQAPRHLTALRGEPYLPQRADRRDWFLRSVFPSLLDLLGEQLLIANQIGGLAYPQVLCPFLSSADPGTSVMTGDSEEAGGSPAD